MINSKLNKLNGAADDSLIFNILNHFHVPNELYICIPTIDIQP